MTHFSTTPDHRRSSLKNIVFAQIFLFALLFGAGAARPAERSDYHTRLSEGIARLSQNDLGGAMQHFEQALAEHPEGAEVPYYIGVVHARAGRTEKAEAAFRKALSLDRTFVPAYFDLGVLYYQTGEDDLALGAFETVERADPDRARIYYYQGLILQRRGNAIEAAAKMERALSLDSDLALEAAFETGVASYRMGDFVLARKSFQKVVALFPESDAAQSAVEFLENIDREEKRGKRWDLSLSLGLQYDDNVIVEPSRGPSAGQTITEKEDVVGLAYLRGRYRWLDTPRWSGQGEYRLYQNLHRKTELNDFNIQSHQLILNGGRRLGKHSLILQYELHAAFLGGASYLFRQAVGPRLTVVESKSHLTEIAYEFGMKRFSDIDRLFPNNSDRDAKSHRLGVTHYVLPESKGNFHGGYLLEREIAGDLPAEDDWSFTGHHLAAGFSLPPWHRWTLAGDAEYILRNFSHENEQSPGEKRNDRELLLIATLSRSFGEKLDIAVQYVHQKNDSNIPIFEFGRNIYGLIATLKF